MTSADTRALWLAGEWARLVPVLRAWGVAHVRSAPRWLRATLHCHDDVADVLAVLVQRAWTARTVPTHPRAWVRVVVENVLRDRRDHARWLAYRTTYGACQWDRFHAASDAPDAWIARDERARVVATLAPALAALAPDARAALTARPPYTARLRMARTRARRALARTLPLTPLEVRHAVA